MNQIVNEKNFIASRLTDNKGNPIPYENLSQAYLRKDVNLTTQSNIEFPLQKSQVDSPVATDRLLNLNDQFVITHLTINLKQIAADLASVTPAQHTLAQLYSWENPQVFSGTNANNVDAIYNGSLRININRRDFMPQFPVRAFRRVPDTQQNLQLLSAGTSGTPADTFTPAGVDSWPNGLYSFYPTDPVLIDGRQTLDFSVNIGPSTAFDDSSNTVWACLIARGYLIVNSKD